MKKKNQDLGLFVQGDVLFQPVSELPSGLKKHDVSIVAFGETSDHVHAVYVGNTNVPHEVLAFGEGDKQELFINVTEPNGATLRHVLESAGISSATWTKEHYEVSLPKGMYKVVGQQQYNAYSKAIERVRD